MSHDFTPRSTRSLDTSKRLFIHYFEQLHQRTGLNWNNDNVSEIEEAVDELFSAVLSKIAEDKRDESIGW